MSSKLLRTQYVILTLKKGVSEWNMQIAPIKTFSPNSFIKYYLKKAIIRNDFEVIATGKNQLVYNSVIKTLKSGSPSVLLLVEELNAQTPNLVWSFDAYNGRLKASNTSGSTVTVQPLGGMTQILGFSGTVSITSGTTYTATNSVDLSPPEAICLRYSGGMSTSSTEVSETNEIKQSDLLCVIGADQPAYGTIVYRDNTAAFAHITTTNSISSIDLRLQDIYGNALVSQNQIILILCYEIHEEIQSQLLDISKHQLDTTRLSLIQRDLENKNIP